MSIFLPQLLLYPVAAAVRQFRFGGVGSRVRSCSAVAVRNVWCELFRYSRHHSASNFPPGPLPGAVPDLY